MEKPPLLRRKQQPGRSDIRSDVRSDVRNDVRSDGSDIRSDVQSDAPSNAAAAGSTRSAGNPKQRSETRDRKNAGTRRIAASSAKSTTRRVRSGTTSSATAAASKSRATRKRTAESATAASASAVEKRKRDAAREKGEESARGKGAPVRRSARADDSSRSAAKSGAPARPGRSAVEGSAMVAGQSTASDSADGSTQEQSRSNSSALARPTDRATSSESRPESASEPRPRAEGKAQPPKPHAIARRERFHSPLYTAPGVFRRTPWWRPPVPWTVYRYIGTEILRVFLLANLAVSLLYTVFVAFQTVRSGIQLGVIWPLIVKTCAYPLYYSIPISFLIAITLVIGRLVSDLEITALRTHGVSHAHIFAPVLLLGCAMAGASYYLNGWVVPEIHYEKRNLHRYVVRQLQNLGSGLEHRVELPSHGRLVIGAYRGTELRKIHIELVAPERSSLTPILRKHLPHDLPKVVSIFAREGSLEMHEESQTLLLTLRSLVILVPETVRGAPIANSKFHQRIEISDAVVVPLSLGHKRPGTKDRTNPDLLQHLDELYARAVEKEAEMATTRSARIVPASFSDGTAVGKDSAAALWSRYQTVRTEWHRRMAFTLSCLSFPLVGVSLALLLHRKSRLIPFFVGNLVIIVVYYPLLMVGVSLGDAGWFPPAALALPNVALLVLGIFLTRRVLKQ